MPFEPTANPPSTTPLVTIAFSGLILLRPGANNTCEIGVHKFVRDHSFQVLLVVNKPVPVPNPLPNPPPTSLRPLPPIIVPLLVGPLTAPFLIRREPDSTAGDFKVFQKDPFNRVHPPSHELDHRWAINFRDLHLNVQSNDGVQPVGTLKTGVLYTPNLSKPSLAPKLRRSGSPDFPLNQINSNLAATIEVPITSDPTAQTKVILEWRDQGDPVSIELPRDGDDPNTGYTIYFINEPPNINAEAHDEFSRYYRVLETGGTPVPGDQRFELVFATGTRTDEIPCAPAMLNP